MRKVPYNSLTGFVLMLAILTCSTAASPVSAPSRVDLTKGSDGLTNDNIRLVLHGVPLQEAAARNEMQLTSPAIVVGPAMDGIGQPRLCRWRHEMLGQQIQVEGIALGIAPNQPSHMTTQRIAYEGGAMFVRGVDFAANGAAGKLVRVTGKLCLEPESTIVFGGQKPITVNKYYYIEAEELTNVDVVTEPRLVAPQLHK